MRCIMAVGLLAALSLTACGGGSATTSETPSGGTPGTADRSYDVSGIVKDDNIAAMLPAGVTSKGTLVIGAATDYAPAEFRGEDLRTPIGYDVDLGKAIGRTLGLESSVEHGEFASLLPGIGTKYDIGISSFTVTSERTAAYDMIAYITVGSSFAVQKGNPKGFNPDDVCGATIGVQTGTYQVEQLETLTAECSSAGKQPVEVLSYPLQSDVTTNLVGGKLDALYADSTVSDYATVLTSGQLEVVGGVREAASQGIVVSKNDPQLTAAIQAAMQKLMDDGTWSKILESWGISTEAGLSTAELNPQA
ncbi:hypothetical protein HMPREF1531_02225 [Propionibacterium sp. oral taxon 192 str. F0372]|uniref:ABC transporter substrate-binding protein n=1 Tax=Propionibacterium sp. oral taxon 192 TaxID=671222 RepID=UPI0003543217|nr:ABC transporter substrate-binding protein [Propionibacterium sp. oral taxon 192]EPH02909.1 hypothetical protein HMPREF1531_02225 [Propionibacterium sp. oral taxon 192 str. F0372]